MQNLKKTIKSYGIDISDIQLNQFNLFEKFIRDYNTHTNLVSQNDIDLIKEKHFIDSVAFLHFINNDTPQKIIDIGSGGGFPVIMEAILLTKSDIFSVDSTSKKVLFLKKASNHLGLKNLSLNNDRIENIAHKKTFREQFDVVTARALGNLAMITELALPLLKIGGVFIAYKSNKVHEEIKEAKNTIDTLGGTIEEIFEYKLTLNENFSRNLVLIRKIKNSPPEFPRSFSIIKSRPL